MAQAFALVLTKKDAQGKVLEIIRDWPEVEAIFRVTGSADLAIIIECGKAKPKAYIDQRFENVVGVITVHTLPIESIVTLEAKA
jgi:hypothetical protein